MYLIYSISFKLSPLGPDSFQYGAVKISWGIQYILLLYQNDVCIVEAP